ncbi:hypothetical protein CUR178_03201 [Leishmania enriettii]|uniref:Uncharacterized protein n=1 Tax=Leishmania enriettii TaxID=5663 RepID=A0A836GE24_LEIEN|nr:hypothetical protein CUR178_03201 [Leishmania enriettii]
MLTQLTQHSSTVDEPGKRALRRSYAYPAWDVAPASTSVVFITDAAASPVCFSTVTRKGFGFMSSKAAAEGRR